MIRKNNNQIVVDSTTNGNVVVNGTEIQVYNDSGIQTALNGKAPTIHSHLLVNITDMDTSNKTNGYALQYDSTVGKFVSKALPSGNGSGATSMSGLSDVDVTTSSPSEGNILTFTSGKWKPQIGSSGIDLGSYTLELSRWGVSNTTITNTADTTLATNNSNGINNAITWASQQGYTQTILPKGSYLIMETIPVQPASYMTLNLGGSTLRVRDNGLAHYSVVCYKQNQVFSRVTNGIIQGDRYNHNYTTVGEASTHEWGMGIIFPNTADTTIGEGVNCRYISIDNLEFKELTGDGVSLFSTSGVIYSSRTPSNRYDIPLEQGSINTTNGSLVVDTTMVRSSIFIDLTHPTIIQWQSFGIYGDVTWNSVGSEIDSTMPFDIIFYNADGTYNSSLMNVEFWDEIPLASGATQAKIVLHQANVPSSGGNGLTLRTSTIPKFVYIEKCHIHHTRRLGVALQGAKWIWVRNNEIHHISGTGPAACMDVEDNYALNQNLYIEDNFFHDTGSNELIIFVKGKNFHIRNNKLERGVIVSDTGVKKLFIEGNYFKDGGIQVDGECVISNNQFHRSRCLLQSGTTETALLDSNIFWNSNLYVDRPKIYCVNISNCRFLFDMDAYNTLMSVGFYAGSYPQTMVNCTFDGYLGSTYLTFSGDVNASEGWSYSNVQFTNGEKPNGNGTIKLPRGTYSNCRFNNSGSLITSKRVEMIGCTFIWDGYNLFTDLGDLSRFVGCSFYGGSSSAFYLSATSNKRIEIINSFIEYPNATATSNSFISGYWGNCTGITIVMDDNRFKSNLAMNVINEDMSVGDVQVVFKNNTVEGSMTYIVTQTNMQFFINNNIGGSIDPYDWVTAAPTTGFYKLGKQLKNSNMATGGFMGWVCTKEGFVDTFSTWAASTTYILNAKITVNNYVYYCTNRLGGKSSVTQPTFPTTPIYSTVSDSSGLAGWTSKAYNIGDKILPTSSDGTYYYECTVAGSSGATEPTWGSANTVVDGGVTWTKQSVIVWKLLGASGATFKQYGTLT